MNNKDNAGKIHVKQFVSFFIRFSPSLFYVERHRGRDFFSDDIVAVPTGSHTRVRGFRPSLTALATSKCVAEPEILL